MRGATADTKAVDGAELPVRGWVNVVDAALGKMEPDVGVQVVGGHHLQQQLEGQLGPPGMQQGQGYVVQNLREQNLQGQILL